MSEELKAMRLGLTKADITYLARNMSGIPMSEWNAISNRMLATAIDLSASEARAKAAEALIRVLLENDPNELVADGGITVLDVWRKDATRTLKGAPDGR